jgi:hypothetical protein
MNLPRFTSGSVGRLTFEHVNEICSLVEQLRPLLVKDGRLGTLGEFETIFARITARDITYGSHQWVEVEPKARNEVRFPSEWQDRVGGRKSNAPADGAAYQPAYAINPFTFTLPNDVQLLDVNTVVCLARLKGVDGKVSWLVVASKPPSAVFPAEIVGAVAIGTTTPTNRWRYYWREVRWNVQAATWETFTGARVSLAQTPDYPTAVNGCEQSSVSWGGIGPGNIVSNLAIPNGTVVPLAFVGIIPFFSLPNPLRIECP